MATRDCLDAASLLAAFTDEVALHDGRVTDSYSDGDLLLARGVLPRVEEVRPGDGLQGGVALRAREHRIKVRPYVFRQVCRNGAIIAHGLRAERQIDLELHEPAAQEFLVREATAACCAADVFDESMVRIEYSANVEAEFALNILPLLERFPREQARRLVREVTDRFFATVDRSRFGLMNAITSLARDTRDPQLRWDLEELGGAVPALIRPHRSPQPKSARAFAPADEALA